LQESNRHVLARKRGRCHSLRKGCAGEKSEPEVKIETHRITVHGPNMIEHGLQIAAGAAFEAQFRQPFGK
jgi:hypothetical protein